MIKKLFIIGLLFLAPYAHASYQLLTAVSTDSPSSTSNESLMPVGTSAWTNLTVRATCRVTNRTTLTNLRIVADSAPENGAGTQSYQFNVMTNAGTSALTATLSETNTLVNDLTNSVVVEAGELFYYQAIPSGTPASLTRVSLSVLANGTVAKDLFYCSTSNGQATGSGATEYLSLAFPQQSSTIESAFHVVMPVSGAFSQLSINLGNAPNNGAGTQGYTWVVNKNMSATALTCSITESDLACSDTSNSFTVVAGDRVSVKMTKTGSPVTVIINTIGLRFTVDTDGQFPIFDSTGNTQLDPVASRYTPIHGGLVSATEAAVDQVSQALMLKNMYVYLSGCITTACATEIEPPFKSYSFSNKVNGISNALNCTISGGSGTHRSCNVTTDITIAAGDLLNNHIVPSNEPIGRNATISYLGAITQNPRRRW